jgi:hypothetical protein
LEVARARGELGLIVAAVTLPQLGGEYMALSDRELDELIQSQVMIEVLRDD